MSSLAGFGIEPVHLARPLPLGAAHRAELAAVLLDGHRVTALGTNDEQALGVLAAAAHELLVIEPDAAQAQALAQRLGVRAEVAEPVDWLQRSGAEELGAVVCLDLSAVAAPAQAEPLLQALARCVGAGVPVLVGVPIGTAPAGEPLPEGIWSAHAARTAVAALGGSPRLIEQHLAEGSAFALEGEPVAGMAELRWPERADLDFGGYLLAAFSLEGWADLPTVLGAAAAPVDALAWHALRDANLALRRTNTKLTRDAFARSGAAAGAALARRDLEITQLRSENEQLRSEVDHLRLRLAELGE